MVDLLDVNRSAVAMELENIYPVGAEGRRGEGQYAEAAREASRELPGMPCHVGVACLRGFYEPYFVPSTVIPLP
jgi:hypothetical protein